MVTVRSSAIGDGPQAATISGTVTSASFSRFAAYGIGTSLPVQFSTGASR